jgi:N-acetylmuramoyl-L-alanine amidase
MMQSNITHIVYHYSATYPDQDYGVDDIMRMHKARGFRTVGYHYVIKRDGTVQKGRGEREIGAHVKGHNTGTIGICCIGGIDRATGVNVGVDNRTPAQMASLERLTRDILTRHPSAKIVGHRDLGATQCPGYDAAQWWASRNADPSNDIGHDCDGKIDRIIAFLKTLKGAKS